LPYATWSELYSYIGSSPAAAMAIYLGLLHMRFYPIKGVKENIMTILLNVGLSPQELKEAQEALNVFVELIERESEKDKVLESLEEGYYDRFKEVLYRFVRREARLEDVKKVVSTLLMLKMYATSETKRGSFEVISTYVVVEEREGDVIIKDFNISWRKLKEIGFYVIILRSGNTYYIIVPAPYIDMDVLKLFEVSERVEMRRSVVEEVRAPAGKFTGLKPSREVLEGIVAEALKNLGFSVVQTNVKLPAKGGDIEVDVWGVKAVSGAQFRVYVSCKNWDRDVDRQVVDQEFGRVLQLYQLPHLRILVVKSLTEPARKAAFDDGFFVIELGEKASVENAQEIYSIIYSKLKEIFIGITPDKIMRVIERLKDALKELEELT
jgi:hypothetical protein